jgi:tetratricopeptide (TPR) repeat protein
MSENPNPPAAAPNPRAKLIVFVLSLLVLLLVYGIGYVALPVSILTKYRGKDCSSILTMNRIYASLYSQVTRDASLVKYAQECEAYALATSSEQNQKWREAYDAYQAYGKNYPSGLYADQVHEHSANALMKIVQDQVEQKKYDEALQNLDLMVTSYSDTSVSAEALPLVLSTYSTWGSDLRMAGNFDQAEHVFNDFKTWSQTNQKSDLQGSAQSQLAETYLAWGESLQAQKEFEAALAKFDQATSISVGSPFDTSKIKADQVKLYIDWGNDLLDQNNYQSAIEKFQLAVSQSAGDASAGDALANGQIQWASSFQASDDFTATLEHLNLAKEAAVTDKAKQSVKNALSDTYLAFSKSSGEQAHRMMKMALLSVCKNNEKPELPIFGLDQNSIRAGIYGIEMQVPDNFIAKTPGGMHFIVCIKEESEIVDRRGFGPIWNGHLYRTLRQYRVRVKWDVSLYNASTGEKISQTLLLGGDPRAFPNAWDELGDGYYKGAPPVEKFNVWLQSVVK